MSEEIVIRARDLSLQSGRCFLLKNVNWEVRRGEHWLVFGMNGSGKTTLLSTVAGFRSPTNGTLEVFGARYSNANVLNLRQKIGWVSSSFFEKCYHHETALHIVLSGVLGTLGVDHSITDAHICRAKALLREFRMGDKMDLPFDMMSKGEQQNVLLARAFLPMPEILVLDEPGTGLDVHAREHMLQTVRDMAEQSQITVIYVTHYPEEIQPFLKKTLMLKNGEVFAQGETDALIVSETLSALLNEPTTVTRSADGRVSIRLYPTFLKGDENHGK